MDFFERQEAAQRKTGILVVYFVIAVLLTIAAVDLAVLMLFRSADVIGVNWSQVTFTSLLTLGVILIGTLKRWLDLREGGSAVAALLGARRVNPDSGVAEERKLLNVVEEMAIASGSAVPPVYVLDKEESVNAFAAGFSPADSVIVVTHGTLQQLSRDELQGVVAHEVAHLLNGDSRLNLKLIGMLGGILAIAGVGRMLLQSRPRYGSRRDGRAEAGRYGLGLALFLIGSIGYFFGKLIQAAVSRQREFLADASAVQFTRNPSGIGGALLKIRQLGSDVRAGGSDEVRHLFFAESLAPKFLRSWLATHPNLDERIRAIDPALLDPALSRGKPALAAAEAPSLSTAQAVSAFTGAITAEAVHRAAKQIEDVPVTLRDAVRTVNGAEAVIAAFVLESEDSDAGREIRSRQDGVLGQYRKDFASDAGAMHAVTRQISREQRLVLIELATSSLKLLSPESRASFVTLVRKLIAADQKTTVFEFVLLAIMSEQLLASDRKGARVNYYALAPLMPDCARVLSLLAHVGARDHAEEMFKRGMKVISSDGHGLLPLAECKPADVERSLHRLRGLAPGLKREFVNALIASVLEDGALKAGERELLMAIGLSIDCPITVGPLSK